MPIIPHHLHHCCNHHHTTTTTMSVDWLEDVASTGPRLRHQQQGQSQIEEGVLVHLQGALLQHFDQLHGNQAWHSGCGGSNGWHDTTSDAFDLETVHCLYAVHLGPQVLEDRGNTWQLPCGAFGETSCWHLYCLPDGQPAEYVGKYLVYMCIVYLTIILICIVYLTVNLQSMWWNTLFTCVLFTWQSSSSVLLTWQSTCRVCGEIPCLHVYCLPDSHPHLYCLPDSQSAEYAVKYFLYIGIIDLCIDFLCIVWSFNTQTHQ